MISCAVLERPGRWRLLGIVAGLALALAPALLLLGQTGGSMEPFGAGFTPALLRSLKVAATAGLIAFAIGLPAGILAALYQFPLRRLLLGLLALPLLVPSFLWAIGLDRLRAALGLPPDSALTGFFGTVTTFTGLALPLALFVSFLAARGISRGQAGAARLAGGEGHLFWQTVRSAWPITALAALLASTLTLSDPGPGAILGYPGIGMEILTSFSAQYDFSLAASQCLWLAGLVLLVALPVAIRLGPNLAAGLLARDVEPVEPAHTPCVAWLGPVLLGAILLTTVALPLLGLLQPLAQDIPVARALEDVQRTLANTFVYALGAGAVAVAVGYALALCAGRSNALRGLLLAGLIVIFALPPSLFALGLVQAGDSSPAWLDSLLRSRLTVCLCLGLRLMPVAAIIAMCRVGSSTPSWADAAAVHGVPLGVYLAKVLAPWLAISAALASLLVALLAAADAGTALLLHPPGEASLPLAIFTVMANAPEALVSTLCLFYLGGAALLLGLGWKLTGFAKTSHEKLNGRACGPRLGSMRWIHTTKT